MTVDLTVPAGEYDIHGVPVVVEGQRYVARATKHSVLVHAGGRATTTVTYQLSQGIRRVTPTKLTGTSVSFAVESPTSNDVIVRRTRGTEPATTPGKGVGVPIAANIVTDSGLEPGTQYTYAFFVRPGDAAHRIAQADGPFVVSIGTSGGQAGTPTYVVNPQTLIATASQISSVVPTGDGLRVTFTDGVPTRALGSAVILPISAILDGGYLGVVRSVATDGSSVELVAGGLLDAFDYYSLKNGDLSAGPADPPAGASGTSMAGTSTDMMTSAAPQAAGVSDERGAAPASVRGQSAPAALFAPAAAAAPVTCGVTENQKADFTPSITAAGHFETTVSAGFLGIPKGISFDTEYAITATGALAIETTGSFACGLKLPELKKQITTYPVPIAAVVGPDVKIGISGAMTVQNVGLAVTAGFRSAGSAALGEAPNFSAAPILTANPLQPQVDKTTGSITLSVGGEGLIGPGVGTDVGGVIAGIGMNLALIKAELGIAALDHSPGYCLSFDLGAELGIRLAVKAWLGNWEAEQSWTLLEFSGSYPSFPRYSPDGCNDAGPGDNILGPGVTKVGDSSVGSPTQSGYLDGIVPGSRAWVLSTGEVSDAVGSPSQFASTGLGTAGDADLSQLSGFPTHDAASYTIDVVPSGTTLKIRYVFASEEYPEYVGSGFNDVMAVYVDGENCALVPGTTQPVSINTINAVTNSSYYVNNTAGTSGYQTTFDGLTKPLVCSVPVAPGVPVQVKIAVADASDYAYDSAVALIDQGIWSE